MSTAARQVRARRGRIMVVGDMPEIIHALPQAAAGAAGPLVARNLFDALGEASVAYATAPISTVLLSEQCLRAAVAAGACVVEAFRKLDPALRLVLIAEPSKGAGATDWQRRGFDDSLSLPLGTAELSRLFDETAAGGSAGSDLGPLPDAVAGPAASSVDSPQALPDIQADRGDAIALDDLRQRVESVEKPQANVATPRSNHAADRVRPGGWSAPEPLPPEPGPQGQQPKPPPAPEPEPAPYPTPPPEPPQPSAPPQ